MSFNVLNDDLLRLNLKQFAEVTGPVTPLRGKEVLYLVQSIEATVGADALLPGQQTEGGWTVEGDLIDEQTKTGRLVGYGTDSESIELTLYAVKGDEGQEALREAKAKHLKIKVWRVELPLNDNDMHDAYFSYAVVESIETSESDSFVELTVSLQIDGQSQKGEIDPLPIELIEAAQYPFEKPGETGVAEDGGNSDDGAEVKATKSAVPKELAQTSKDKK